MYKYTINNINEWAKNRGGECLDPEYKGIHTKLSWKCKMKHIWKATPHDIKYNRWCPYCSGNAKLTINEMINISKERGGQCLSTEYKGSHINLKWQCILNHIWWASPSNVKRGSWCPCCSTRYIIEHKCRFIIEQITEYKFPSNWNILKNRQQIDGFNKELKIGFEYNGKQHYEEVDRFSKEEFKLTQQRDKRKKSRIYYLKKQGIIRDIIFIKYTQATSDKKLENYIIKRLNKIDPNLIKNKKVDYSGFYKYLSPLNDIKKIVEDKGGELLDDFYINSGTKLKVSCKNNHIFMMTSNHIKKNHWCPHCSGNARISNKYICQLAAQNNCTCIESLYKNNHTKIQWKCNKCKELFRSSYMAIKKRKYFCKKCK